MQIIQTFSTLAIPGIILIIVIYGIVEKKKVYDLFMEGAKEGAKIVITLFPTLLGLFMAVSMLRSSGILDFIVKIIMPIATTLHLPSEILPLAMLRPISGSAAMAIAIDMMNQYGVDSVLRKNNLNNYGFNRNNILYNSNLHSGSKNKKNPLCVSSGVMWRLNRYDSCKYSMSNDVIPLYYY